MAEAGNPSALVVWGGFVLAFIFGAVANKTNFCTMGALSDVVNMAHWGRMRMWLLAIAVAVVGATVLHATGQIDLSKSIYVRPTLPLLSLVVGGALFGVGMTVAGGCVNKNLVRVGGGSLRSLVVLVFVGISAYMTLKGLFGQWRVSYLDPVALDLSKWGLTGQTLPQLLSKATGLAERSALWLSMAVVSLALLGFAFKDKRFRSNTNQVMGGVVLGLLVTAAWYLTGHIGHGENPDTLEIVYFATNTRTLESFSFVAPVAFSLELLMLWTDKSLLISFGIASALGVVLGSMAYALASRQFRWEGFASVEDLRTQLLGAVLMGFGGVTALGCTVGQGLTGVSTLALGSFIGLASIMAGCVATLHYQNWRA
ncbi:MAG: YeeE/YedE family protein [Rhodoferax sp.]